MRTHWHLDPDVRFLNHGSFGACPKVVLQSQARWQQRLERAPVQFLSNELPALFVPLREKLGKFLGAGVSDFVFTSNASEGINAVLRSLKLHQGDELLTTDHAYAACRNALDFVAQQSGAVIRVAKIPFPLQDPEQVLQSILSQVSARTVLAMIDHVTSITGLVLPIERIVSELKGRGVETLVDGAHAPGMVELNLDRIGAAAYAANFHKWGCAPKGAALLHVRKDWQPRVVPLVISHGFHAPDETRFQALFGWTGTRDPSPWLCVPEALDFLASLVPGGLSEVRVRNRQLALSARDTLCEALEIAHPAPDVMIGSLASVPLGRAASGSWPEPLYLELVSRGFEVLLLPSPSDQQLVLRVSAHLYNQHEEYEALALVMKELLAS